MAHQRKATHITRKNYYLTLDEKLHIREYIHANPNLTQPQVAERFGISRGTVSNINKIPYHKEHYEKMIFELTNTKNAMAARLAAMDLKIMQLQTKLAKYE
jgi:predicted XRE-type DNA-binding protein